MNEPITCIIQTLATDSRAHSTTTSDTNTNPGPPTRHPTPRKGHNPPPDHLLRYALLNYLPPSPPTPPQPPAHTTTSPFHPTPTNAPPGANDSRLPHTPPPTTPQQHLPPSHFKSNLQTLLSHPRVASHARARIILITPPPVDERMLRATDAANIPGFSGLRRTARTTAMYAEAVREVGRERGVGVCDVWGGMVGRAGWRDGDGEGEEGLVGEEGVRESEVLRGFLSDGMFFLFFFFFFFFFFVEGSGLERLGLMVWRFCRTAPLA